MKLGEVAAAALQQPAELPEQLPERGQLMRFGKLSVLLAFQVGET